VAVMDGDCEGHIRGIAPGVPNTIWRNPLSLQDGRG
jgi:hypothetical protein